MYLYLLKSNRKKRIVDRMYPAVVRDFAFSKGLHPKSSNGGRPNINAYIHSIVSKVQLGELIEFAIRKKIPIRDITDEIDKENTNKEIKSFQVMKV